MAHIGARALAGPGVRGRAAALSVDASDRLADRSPIGDARHAAAIRFNASALTLLPALFGRPRGPPAPSSGRLAAMLRGQSLGGVLDESAALEEGARVVRLQVAKWRSVVAEAALPLLGRSQGAWAMGRVSMEVCRASVVVWACGRVSVGV